MTRLAISCGLMLAACVQASASGLQSALITNLIGLQAAATTTSVVGNNASITSILDVAQQRRQRVLDEIAGVHDLLEGSLFVDPFASTLGNGVFGPGPELVYDPQTGGVTITAPPLLGPADEFGLRRTYAARTIRLETTGQLASTFSLPEITDLTRNGPTRFEWFRGTNLPVTDDSPSFVPLETFSSSSAFVPSASFRVSREGNEVSITSGLRFGGDPGALRAAFDQLLETEIEASQFSIATELLTTDGIAALQDRFSLLSSGLTEFLPSIYAVIEYDLVGRPAGALRVPTSFTLLAIPTSVPEPSSALMCLMGLTAALLPRRLAPRIA